MTSTTFIPALPKSIDEESLSQRKSDYKKIRKTLIRDITSDGKREENEQWSRLQQMTYDEYLDHVGMVPNDNTISMEDRISFAHKRYLEALKMPHTLKQPSRYDKLMTKRSENIYVPLT